MECVRHTYPPSGKNSVSCANYIALPKSEWQHWSKLVAEDPKKLAIAQTEKRGKELLAASKAKVSQWSNTIQAIRTQKELERVERLEAEEQRRLVIDTEEAQIKTMLHQQSLNRANLMLFEEQERVRSFRSRLMLAGILEERAHQCEIKKVKHTLRAQEDHTWHIRKEREQEEHLKEEAAKDETRKAKQRALRKDLRDQLEALKEIKLTQLREDKAEGQMIAEEAKAQEIKEVLERQARHIRTMELSKEILKAKEDTQAAKDMRKKVAAEEVIRLEKYRRQKEEFMAERQWRVEEKFNLKLQKRQEVIDQHAETVLAVQKLREQMNENAMLNDKSRTEELQKIKEAQDACKRKELLEDIRQSRALQLKRNEHSQALERQKEHLRGEAYRRTAQEQINEEVEELVQRRERSVACAQVQLLQAQRRSHEKALEAEHRRIAGLMMMKATEREDTMFKDYVGAVVRQCEEAGVLGLHQMNQTKAIVAASAPIGLDRGKRVKAYLNDDKY